MSPSTEQELRHWLAQPEGGDLEFKEANHRFDFDKLADYCVALANGRGGKIILGATDQRPRRIVGTEAFPEPGQTEAALFQRLHHSIPIEEMRATEGRVLVVHVPSRLPGAAWEHKGRFLKREGDSLAALSDFELRQIFSETGPDFSSEFCPNATLADLSPQATAAFRELWAKKSGDNRKLTWSDLDILVAAELIVDNKVTYAALILLGTSAALGRHLGQAELVFEYRSSDASGPAAAREQFREGFLLRYDDVWNAINLRNDRQSYQEGLFRFELPTFDEIAVREALLNAIAHRDYRLGGSIFVRQFPRRLEVVSPGGFPAGITPENVLEQQNPRNRRLAEVLAKCGLIERSGQGMNLMFENAIRQGKPLPDFSGTSDHEVRLTLEGSVRHPEFVRYLERLGANQLLAFSTDDFLALDAVHRELSLSGRLRLRLPNLVSVGAVETVGRGKGVRHILSQSLYAAIGAKGTYTRKRGLNRATNKALLERHLSDQGQAGSPLSELRQVLPAESGRAIQALLAELRKEGHVSLKGTRRWARWVTQDPKATTE